MAVWLVQGPCPVTAMQKFYPAIQIRLHIRSLRYLEIDAWRQMGEMEKKWTLQQKVLCKITDKLNAKQRK